MSGNDWLKPKKPPCEGSYELPDGGRRRGFSGLCPACGRRLRLTAQGRIPRHNAPPEAVKE